MSAKVVQALRGGRQIPAFKGPAEQAEETENPNPLQERALWGRGEGKPRVDDGEEPGLVRSEPPRGPLLVCSHNSQK